MGVLCVCVAGTFDGLHAGHEVMLRKAFEAGKKVIIGLTSDAYVKQYRSNQGVRSYEIRHKELHNWLDKHACFVRATIVPIDNPFEPAASDASLDALVVSVESKSRGEELNKMRKAKGLSPLELIVMQMVPAQDTKPISTSRVRNGEIDSSGRLTMPDSLRGELAQPMGDVLTDAALRSTLASLASPGHARLIVTVGDFTTKAFLDAGVVPELMVVDHRVNRKEYPDLRPVIQKYGFRQQSVQSGPGYISREAERMIASWFDSPQTPHVIVVDGEEDLLALPSIAEAPIGAVVYYGQPSVPGSTQAGVVEVVVTKDKKHEAKSLLSRFVS